MKEEIKDILNKCLNYLEPSMISDCVYRTPQAQLQMRIDELNAKDKLISDIKKIISEI